MKTFQKTIWCALLAGCCALALAAEPSNTPVAVDIARQPLRDALAVFAKQTGLQVMLREESVAAERQIVRTVKGTLSPREALGQLLEQTNLRYEFVTQKMVRISSATPGPDAAEVREQPLRLAQVDRQEVLKPAETNEDERTQAIPEMLVKGSRSLNVDIVRSRDDAQPYVIFDRKTIERSGARNLDDFLKQRLTMNTQGSNNEGGIAGATSRINLRGLGSSNTLILIDGHRAVGNINFDSSPPQADLNNLPLAAVERIEVLPTTASGIYGGSAVGGVVNVILRRDYAGAEVKLTYENTFSSDASVRRIDFGSGLNFEEGRTNVMFAGSYSDQNPLTAGERDFVRQGRDILYRNNPAFFTGPTVTPPLGATANIRSSDGSPLFGPGTSYFTSVPVGYTGGGGLAAFQARAGVYNLDLAPSAQARGASQALLGNPTNKMLMLTVRREFTPWLRAYVDLSGSDSTSRYRYSYLYTTYTVNATAPNNPFGRNILVTVPIGGGDGDILTQNDNRQAVGGLIVSLPRRWEMALDYTWQRATWLSNSTTPTAGGEATAVRNGVIDVLRDAPIDISQYFTWDTYSPRHSTMKDAVLRFSGPVGSLPGGEPVVSASVESRKENFDTLWLFTSGVTYVFPERFQEVSSAYLETKLPLFSQKNARRWVKSLELQAAGRMDEYKVVGATSFIGPLVNNVIPPFDRPRNTTRSTDPTFAIRYQPVRDVIVRASYGTGFLPPSTGQLMQGSTMLYTLTNLDPLRGGAQLGNVMLTQGGNADLKPERSKSHAVGVVFEPAGAPGLRLSVDWSRIVKTDNIGTLSTQQLVDNEAFFPGRITRSTDPSTFGSYGVGPITALNITSVNTAKAKVEAYDLAADYGWQTAGWGDFAFYLQATRQMYFKSQLVPSAAETDLLGIAVNNPQAWKANAGLSWSHRQLTLSWVGRYFDTYRIANPASTSYNQTVLNQGGTHVPSQVYHDLFAAYDFSGDARSPRSGVLSSLELQLGVRNVLNKEPPFDVNASEYFSTLGDPRLASYYLTLRTSF